MIDSETSRIFLQILVDGSSWKKGKPEETAILLLPGTYQEYRITEGAKLWPKEGKYFWVAGTRGDPAYCREDIIAVTKKDSPNIICQGFAKHTLDQMEWCIAMLKENSKIKHLVITTSAYHLPRCTLTLLQSLKKSNIQVSITPIPIKNPKGDSFSIDSTEDFVLEIKKIQEYQQKGDVASLESWREYLEWRIL